MQMGFDAKTFAAAVMDMAVKGYLSIWEANELFVLEKKQDAQLFPEERSLGSDLFAGNKTLEISQKHQRILANSQEKLETSLKKMLDTIYFKTNRRYLWPAAVITLSMLGALLLTAEDRAAGQSASSSTWLAVCDSHDLYVLGKIRVVPKNIFTGFRCLLVPSLSYDRSGRGIFFHLCLFNTRQHPYHASLLSVSSQSADA